MEVMGWCLYTLGKSFQPRVWPGYITSEQDPYSALPENALLLCFHSNSVWYLRSGATGMVCQRNRLRTGELEEGSDNAHLQTPPHSTNQEFGRGEAQQESFTLKPERVTSGGYIFGDLVYRCADRVTCGLSCHVQCLEWLDTVSLLAYLS